MAKYQPLYPHVPKTKEVQFPHKATGEHSQNPQATPGSRRFPLGQMVLTGGVNDKVAVDTEFAKFVTASIARHAAGDWGDLSEEDKKENEYSLDKHLRLFSAYDKYPMPKIWIITEADRSATTVLFPEEY